MVMILQLEQLLTPIAQLLSKKLRPESYCACCSKTLKQPGLLIRAESIYFFLQK